MPRGTHPNSLANLKKGKPFNAETASKAGKKGAPESNKAQAKTKTLSELAKIINGSEVTGEKARKQLKLLGIKDDDMTNAALIVSGIFRAAFEGDMKAVEKWERLTGQAEDQQTHGDILASINDVLSRRRDEHD